MQAAAEASPETADADGPESLRILVCTPVYGDSVKRGYAHSVAWTSA
jgi:hypothetical protein